jgi:hypothetical protein
MHFQVTMADLGSVSYVLLKTASELSSEAKQWKQRKRRTRGQVEGEETKVWGPTAEKS